MQLQQLQSNIGDIDIYVLDQILKERYAPSDKILDAGCGSGRNLKWFYNSNYDIFGTDTDAEAIASAKKHYNTIKDRFTVQAIEHLSFDNATFNHVICNAVLHFAKNTTHFFALFSELVRVVKPKGSLFIRMASNFGIETTVEQLHHSEMYLLPDGTERFLLTPELLKTLISTYKLKLLEPVKTTNVDNLRCMTTLVVQV